MFNNWLKRRDDEPNDGTEENKMSEEKMLMPVSNEVDTSNKLDYDNGDDDYYYYYYYEGDNKGKPSIPNLNQTIKEKEEALDYYNVEDDSYVSPFSTDSNTDKEKIQSDNFSSDYSYEEEYGEVSSNESKVTVNQLDISEIEMTQLREKIDHLLLENDTLQGKVDRLARVEENNNRLSAQIDEYGNLLEENNQLKIQLLDLDKFKIDSEKMAKEIDTLNTNVSEKEQVITQLNSELSDKTAEADNTQDLIGKLTESNQLLENKLAELNQVTQNLNVSNQKISESSQTLELKNKQIEEQKQLIETLKTDNESFIKEIEVLQKTILGYKEQDQSMDQEILEKEDVQRRLTELEAKLSHAKELENKLISKYEEELEKNQKFELTMKKKEQELTDMNEKLSQTEQLEKELEELKNNQRVINDLQQELSNMRQQQEDVTTSLTELRSAKTPEVTDLQMELAQVKEELRLSKLRADQGLSMSQSDIASVMLEAQAKARQIVDVANYEAKRRVADSETELSAISQEARNYYRKLEKLRVDSEIIFSDLLRKLETMGDIDRF